MRFYLDENFPIKAASFLIAKGHEVWRAVDLQPQGIADRDLLADAQAREAIFLTTDKDFFHTVPFFLKQRKAPVVVITLAQSNSERIVRRLEALLAAVDLSAEPSAVFLVRDHRILKRLT